jgi:hypothetical protein
MDTAILRRIERTGLRRFKVIETGTSAGTSFRRMSRATPRRQEGAARG